MRRLLLAAILAAPVLTTQSAYATGLYTCDATDREDWLTEVELTDLLEADGWSVRRMKEDGGCWEVYGTTPEGQRVEGYFHPVTGAPQLISQRGRVLFKVD